MPLDLAEQISLVGTNLTMLGTGTLVCVNIGGFNRPSQKQLNIAYFDEDRPLPNFQSHRTIFLGPHSFF